MTTTMWKHSTIGELILQCDYGLSCALSADPVGVPILRMGNLLNGQVSLDDLKYVPSQMVAEKDYVEKGDILLNRTNSLQLVGKVGLYKSDARVAFASYLFRLRANASKAHAEWLAQLLGSPAYQARLRELATPGVSQANINREVLRGVAVPLPPLNEQRKIAAILSSVDDAIEANQAVMDQLQVVKKATMAELLTRGLPGRHTRFKKTEIGEVPEEWEIVPIGSIGSVITGSTPSTNNASYWNGDIPFVTPADLGLSRKIYSAARQVTESGLLSVRALPEGAILVTCIGATIGKMGVAGTRCCTNQQINAVICLPGVMLWYMYYAILSAKPRIVARASQTAVPIISKGLFRNVLVPLPSVDEQEKIGQALVAIDDLIEQYRALSESYQDLKASLMNVLLTGEIRVTPDEASP